jgi:hypothetical protein
MDIICVRLIILKLLYYVVVILCSCDITTDINHLHVHRIQLELH